MIMYDLKSILSQKIPLWREEIRQLVESAGSKQVSEVTVSQIYRGLRDVEALICDTSYVDPVDGLYIRGIHVDNLLGKLPEEVFFLLCTGELPNRNQYADLQQQISSRANIPSFVRDMISNAPEHIPPIVLFSMIFTAMSSESVFRHRYFKGMPREEHWQATLEDALDILAKGPVIVAAIYRQRILKKEIIPPDPSLDMGANLAHMLGFEKETFQRMLRLFILLHSDHEGGSVSVNTTRIVNSALSDSYLSIAAGMNGLAGPLHGMANQYSVKFILELLERFNGVPSEAQLTEVIMERINNGRKIPGFGHAVLRYIDPRFRAFFNFGKKEFPDDPLFQVIEKLTDVVPPLLKKHTQVKDPYPNIDLISGVLLYHFGMKELEFYPLMFGVSLLLGMNAQLIINRALLSPIFRPKSVTTAKIKNLVQKNQDG